MSVSLKFVVISILLAECVSESKGACDIGYWGAECKEKCAEGCFYSTGCDVDNGVCSSCIDGFYGPHCDIRCVENCINCEQDTGLCRTCEYTWYGALCNKQCSSNCYYCDKTDGACRSCPDGYWGPNCESECKPVGECDRNCSTVSYVSPCEHACKCYSCDKTTGECSTCAYRFWGIVCNRNCPPNCRQDCDRYTGTCRNCIDGYWGTRCQYPCRSDHCLQCNTHGHCDQCQNGYWGPQCEHQCMKCGVCNKRKGNCEKCPDGSWGQQCEKQCTECVTCNIYRGYCDSCQPGYWGQKCDRSCPSECTGCDVDGGYCTSNGCSSNNCVTEEQISTGGNISIISIVGIAMIAVGTILFGSCVIMMFCMIRRLQIKKNQTSGSKASNVKGGYEMSHQQADNNDGEELYDRPVYEDT